MLKCRFDLSAITFAVCCAGTSSFQYVIEFQISAVISRSSYFSSLSALAVSASWLLEKKLSIDGNLKGLRNVSSRTIAYLNVKKTIVSMSARQTRVVPRKKNCNSIDERLNVCYAWKSMGFRECILKRFSPISLRCRQLFEPFNLIDSCVVCCCACRRGRVNFVSFYHVLNTILVQIIDCTCDRATHARFTCLATMRLSMRLPVRLSIPLCNVYVMLRFRLHRWNTNFFIV